MSSFSNSGQAWVRQGREGRGKENDLDLDFHVMDGIPDVEVDLRRLALCI